MSLNSKSCVGQITDRQFYGSIVVSALVGVAVAAAVITAAPYVALLATAGTAATLGIAAGVGLIAGLCACVGFLKWASSKVVQKGGVDQAMINSYIGAQTSYYNNSNGDQDFGYRPLEIA